MEMSTIETLISVAPALLRGEFPEYPTRVERRAIEILNILKDGQWYTPSEIAESLGVGKKYVSDILRALRRPWCLETKQQHVRNQEKYWKMKIMIKNNLELKKALEE